MMDLVTTGSVQKVAINFQSPEDAPEMLADLSCVMNVGEGRITILWAN